MFIPNQELLQSGLALEWPGTWRNPAPGTLRGEPRAAQCHEDDPCDPGNLIIRKAGCLVSVKIKFVSTTTDYIRNKEQ